MVIMNALHLQVSHCAVQCFLRVRVAMDFKYCAPLNGLYAVIVELKRFLESNHRHGSLSYAGVIAIVSSEVTSCYSNFSHWKPCYILLFLCTFDIYVFYSVYIYAILPCDNKIYGSC